MAKVAEAAGVEMLAVAQQLVYLSLELVLRLMPALASKWPVGEVGELHSQLMGLSWSREIVAKRRIEIAELLAVESEQIAQLG